MPANHVSQRTTDYQTRGGVRVIRSVRAAPPDADLSLVRELDERRGMWLASSYEYPGRYVRAASGFIDPPLVLESHGTELALTALNDRGRVLLPACENALRGCPGGLALVATDYQLRGCVTPRTTVSSEEERTRRDSVLLVVRALCDLFASPADDRLGFYGAFGYDLVFQFEALQQRHARTSRPRELVLYLPDSLLVVEPAQQRALYYDYDFELPGGSTRGICRGRGAGPTAAPSAFEARPAAAWERDHTPEEFIATVQRARDAFAAGDLFEVTPSQVFTQPCAAAPSAIFAALSHANPAPYGFCMNLGEQEFLVGASPEMYVRARSGRIETCPIAGTIARGCDAFSDAAQILTLLNSEKDSAELTMCTDVDRNDKARICEPGSVRVIGRRQIELYSRLIHTVDHVEGQLREGYGAIDALLTHMWAVTVTGAPKLAALQFIEEHEKSPRGFYGGAIGRLQFDGTLDTGLILRALHIQGGVVRVRAGATLHFDSDPASEQLECELKASAVLSAIEQAARAPEPSGLPHAAAKRAKPSGTVAPLRVLVIDHRDSFVHTLGDYFRQASCRVTTVRYGFEKTRYAELEPELVVLSPGPGRPDDFAMRDTLRELAALGVPVFGVCLGLQGMVEFCGGSLARLPTPVHGKASPIRTTTSTTTAALFRGLPNPLRVGRYHSLCAAPGGLPSELQLLAQTEADGCIMAVAHRARPWFAVQFHPESILTTDGDHGLRLIQNVVDSVRTA